MILLPLAFLLGIQAGLLFGALTCDASPFIPF